MYNIVSAADVRQALSANPTNVANLVEVLSQHLFALIPSDGFPNSNAPAETGKVASTTQVLNCLRVLGRVIVIVYEAQADGIAEQTWADLHLFSRKRVKREAPAPAEENQFTIADDDDDDEDDETDALNPRKLKASLNDPLSNPTPAAAEDDDAHTELLPSLADRLFSVVIDLLFCAGFSVPESVRGIAGTGDKINVGCAGEGRVLTDSTLSGRRAWAAPCRLGRPPSSTATRSRCFASSSYWSRLRSTRRRRRCRRRPTRPWRT